MARERDRAPQIRTTVEVWPDISSQPILACFCKVMEVAYVGETGCKP